MPSAEGKGRARQAWDAYSRTTNKILRPVVDPLLGPSIKSFSANTVADLMGFWLLWQLHGGHAGLRDLGMSRASIYRKVAMFRKVTGIHPDEFELPGVELDVAAYLSGGAQVSKQQARAKQGKSKPAKASLNS
jgi:hypothetical protein